MRGELRESSEDVTTLAERLRSHAAERPTQIAVRFLGKAEQDEVSVTYGDLDRWARRVAVAARARFGAGTRALLMCPPGLSYVAGFYGCLYGGLIPVPVYPPSPMVPGRAINRLRAVAQDVEAGCALSVDALRGLATSMEVRVGARSLEWVYVDALEPGGEDGWEQPEVDPRDVAFLQYTSGSTADPKGVMLTHANLRANLDMIGHEYGFDEQTRPVSWLPPFHDMGLMAGIITPLWMGGTTVLMTPDSFLRRPLRWLEAISRFGGDFSAAPNFAYELCTRRAATADVSNLDLHTWRVAVNGAEPVRADTMHRFVETFGPCGFSSDTFWPSYGMAETVVMSSCGRLGSSADVLPLDVEALSRGQVVRSSDPRKSVRKVTCGSPAVGSDLLVVDPSSGALSRNGEIGEIWLRGPHVGAGYWRRPVETSATFRASLADGTEGSWLRTGDLGAVVDGRVMIAGRLKDLLIIRGVNHYPQDIERSMEEAHAALRAGCGVAFTVDDERGERLVLVQGLEDRRDEKNTAAQAAEDIRRKVTYEHAVQPDAVALVAPKHVERTSSGKVRRSATRAAWLDGSLPIIYQWIAPDWTVRMGVTDSWPPTDASPEMSRSRDAAERPRSTP